MLLLDPYESSAHLAFRQIELDILDTNQLESGPDSGHEVMVAVVNRVREAVASDPCARGEAALVVPSALPV